jgi:hypothetical protein
MAHPGLIALSGLERLARSVQRFFGAPDQDPLEARLDQARSAGTPLTEEEARDLAEARAEIRRGESTTDPLGLHR